MDPSSAHNFSAVVPHSATQWQSLHHWSLDSYSSAIQGSKFFLLNLCIFKWVTKSCPNHVPALQPGPSMRSWVPSEIRKWVPSAINTVHTIPSQDLFQAKLLSWVNRRWQACQFANFPCMTDSAWLTRYMLMRMCQLTTKTFLNNLKLQSLVCQIIQFIV